MNIDNILMAPYEAQTLSPTGKVSKLLINDDGWTAQVELGTVYTIQKKGEAFTLTYKNFEKVSAVRGTHKEIKDLLVTKMIGEAEQLEIALLSGL